ncbi:MAG: hypothetical protein HZB25_12130 [Candidatus Eisenbacteria bacterium]|nr:hypothetical protein [Candidatus Eisenbacteria bacterium]
MKTPRILRLLGPILVLGALLAAGGARAQSCADAQREILAADRQLDLVGPVVRESGDRDALDRFGKARELLDRAKMEFSNSRCAQAARMAGKARELANEALLRARPGAGERRAQPEFVRRELERTDEVLSRVATRVRESGNDRSQIILDRSLQGQARAWGLFREATVSGRADESKLRSALEMTMKARDGARLAFNFGGDNRGMNPDRIAEELRQTDEQIATAVEWSRTAAGTGSSAAEQIDVARALEERARRHFEQREYPEALRLTLRAREIVRRALAGADRVDAAELERALQAAQTVIERARTSTLSPMGSRLLGQAETRYARALEQREAGRPWVALLNARAARTLALRALGTPP